MDAENTDLTYGQAVARAVREYRQDSWEQRIEALTEHIHAQLTALNVGIPVDLDTDAADGVLDSSNSSDPDQVDDVEEEKDPYYEKDKIEAIREDILDRWPEPVEEIEEIGGMIPEAWFTESIDRWCAKGDREQATDKTRRKYLDLVVDEFGLGRSGANFVVGELDGLAFERKDYVTSRPRNALKPSA